MHRQFLTVWIMQVTALEDLRRSEEQKQKCSFIHKSIRAREALLQECQERSSRSNIHTTAHQGVDDPLPSSSTESESAMKRQKNEGA